MPSTEQIHDEEARYYEELHALPGYADARRELMDSLKGMIRSFECVNGLRLGEKWVFRWNHTPETVRALINAMMDEFPGVAEVKRRYGR